MLAIAWLQAVIDLPADRFAEAGDFWAAITASGRGEVHPDHDEFVHLVPAAGDRHLELQRINDGAARVHLDILVADIAASAAAAVEAGAVVVADPGHVVLRSPGGLDFCIVPFFGEHQLPVVIDAEVPHAVDQICLDIPHDLFSDEVDFWQRLTGWAVHPPRFAEFRSFDQPTNLPLRVLIQQLGADDTGGARAHLDISSGDRVAHITERHVHEHGARPIETHEHWTALRGPAGLPYCVTSRRPAGLG